MIYNEEIVSALAENAYLSGDAGFDIEPEKSALLIIDMQDEFVKPEWTPFWVPEATRQVAKIKALAEFCREKKIPVIYTVLKNTHFYADRPKTGASMPNRYNHLEHDPEWFKDGRIWHELTPEENEIVIFKPSYGAFCDTPLETILRNRGIDTIIICGTLTNFCCGTTARQGYERGFKVIFGSDINSTDYPVLQEYELMNLRKGFARVMEMSEIMKNLER